VLTNISTDAGADDIGRHLLNASYPLLKVKPPTERQEITLDPKIFDRYVATYQLSPYTLATISRDGDRFYGQLTGQPKLEIFAENERSFFLKAVDAQLTFDATSVTLHQNGADSVAKRLNDAEVKRAVDDIDAHNAEIAKRFREQAQSPGTEAALRRAVQELQRGEPDYDLMSAQLAALTRQQLPQLKTTIAQFGALQSVSFKGVGPGGADIYEVKFEHATTEWRVALGPDGKTQGLGFRPL